MCEGHLYCGERDTVDTEILFIGYVLVSFWVKHWLIFFWVQPVTQQSWKKPYFSAIVYLSRVYSRLFICLGFAFGGLVSRTEDVCVWKLLILWMLAHKKSFKTDEGEKAVDKS